MTKKRFKVQNMLKDFIIGEDTDLETLQELVEEYGSTAKIELFITDNGKKMTYEKVETLLNHFYDENWQLKQEKDILSNELSIAQEQGYEPSKSYKEYIASIKTEYDKFWENKIKTHNNRLKGS